MPTVIVPPEVERVAGPGVRALVEQTLTDPMRTCWVCSARLDARTEPVTVGLRRPAGQPDMVVLTTSHSWCAAAGVDSLSDLELAAMIAGGQRDALALFGALDGECGVVACDIGSDVHVEVGRELAEATPTIRSIAGFTVVTHPLEHLDPRTVPVLRGWAVRLDDEQLVISDGSDGGPIYVQDTTEVLLEWANLVPTGPVLVLAGSGLAPAEAHAGEQGDWSASIDGVRRQGRLLAARMPFRWATRPS